MVSKNKKILAVSDQVVEGLHSTQIRDVHCDTDLVISCGDLPYYYLEFIVTMLPIPLIFVFGNHDKHQHTADGRVVTEPGGGISVEGRVRNIDGLLVAGLGGSMRYNPGAVHQYSEREMRQRVIRLLPSLLLNKVIHGRYMDILVTHSPPFGIHDGEDLPHTGFKVFLTLMRYFKPRYLLHGHKHIYRRDTITATTYHETTVINVYPSRTINFEGN